MTTARIVSTAATPAWQPPEDDPTGPAGPSVEGAWLAWPVRVEAQGEDQRVLVPHAPGDPVPGHARVAAALAAVLPAHPLAGAHLEHRVTTRAFAFRLRSSEKRAIRDADRAVGDWTPTQREVAGDVLTEMDQATYIDVALPLTELLVRRLERVGFLAPGRGDAILAIE